MPQSTLNLMVGTDHAVPVEPLGQVATVLVQSGGTVYWNDTPTVSPTINRGTITVGTPQSFAGNIWLLSTSLSTVQATLADVVVQAAAGGPPVTYQTVSPSGGDDTANINAAIAAVYANGVANGSHCGEVWFDCTKGPFTVNGPLIAGGAAQARAQIPLPNPPVTGQKFVLALRGMRPSSPLAHWSQQTPQKSGACLVTNLVTTFDATFGSGSCIGGPTVEQVGSQIFSNLLFVMDGITIVSPANPTGAAVDLQCVAECHIPSIALSGSIAPNNLTPDIGLIAAAGGIGLRMPRIWNNDMAEIGSASIEGYALGFVPGEHTHAGRVAVIYAGQCVYLGVGWNDSARIDYLSTEVFQYGIDGADLAGTNTGTLHIGTWDIEDDANVLSHLYDPSNHMRGSAVFQRNAISGGGGGTTTLLVNGAVAFKAVCGSQATGHVTSPSVPASTVALANPFGRDAAVTVSGGTVTVIAVDGTATGLASTGHTVIVPSGKTITLTYSVAPSWNWVLL